MKRKFSTEKPLSGQHIAVITEAQEEWPSRHVGYYKDSKHHTYPNEIHDRNGVRVESFTDEAAWVYTDEIFEAFAEIFA